MTVALESLICVVNSVEIVAVRTFRYFKIYKLYPFSFRLTFLNHSIHWTLTVGFPIRFNTGVKKQKHDFQGCFVD